MPVAGSVLDVVAPSASLDVEVVVGVDGGLRLIWYAVSFPIAVRKYAVSESFPSLTAR